MNSDCDCAAKDALVRIYLRQALEPLRGLTPVQQAQALRAAAEVHSAAAVVLAGTIALLPDACLGVPVIEKALAAADVVTGCTHREART